MYSQAECNTPQSTNRAENDCIGVEVVLALDHRIVIILAHQSNVGLPGVLQHAIDHLRQELSN